MQIIGDNITSYQIVIRSGSTPWLASSTEIMRFSPNVYVYVCIYIHTYIHTYIHYILYMAQQDTSVMGLRAANHQIYGMQGKSTAN